MKELIKRKLEFDPALSYFQYALDNANALSTYLLNLVNFKCGSFYTLLPKVASLEEIYEFNRGNVLPQNPSQKYLIAEEVATLSEIPTIKKEISEFIFRKITLRRAFSCIIDDVNGSIDSKFQCETIKCLRRSYLKEVYYFLDKQNVTIELVLKCLQKSNAFWHSLCVLTNVKLKIKKSN